MRNILSILLVSFLALTGCKKEDQPMAASPSSLPPGRPAAASGTAPPPIRIMDLRTESMNGYTIIVRRSSDPSLRRNCRSAYAHGIVVKLPDGVRFLDSQQDVSNGFDHWSITFEEQGIPVTYPEFPFDDVLTRAGCASSDDTPSFIRYESVAPPKTDAAAAQPR